MLKFYAKDISFNIYHLHVIFSVENTKKKRKKRKIIHPCALTHSILNDLLDMEISPSFSIAINRGLPTVLFYEYACTHSSFYNFSTLSLIFFFFFYTGRNVLFFFSIHI